ncbi:MAG: calcium/sodium antiporter [Planctomycetaceae bacterium]|nr:calcium/sodium antiporter [Planctomycetaceae bacterium]
MGPRCVLTVQTLQQWSVYGVAGIHSIISELPLTVLILIVGLVILTVGAEVLVRGASRLAIACRISPLVVGLTVVAFGTSAPELVVSMRSALGGDPEVAVGNVVGSNIANVLLILGLAALITPLTVSQQLIRLDVPLMIAASIAVAVMAWDGNISQMEGAVLFAALIWYNVWVVRKSRQESKAIEEEYAREFGSVPPDGATSKMILTNALLLVAGLVMLVVGANMFVSSAVTIARTLGVSELVIGLTLVAVGTSLPEVATSLVAAYRGERDIAVGNVVGSNLFNILCVLGLTGTCVKGGIPIPESAVTFDIPVMILVSLACLPVFVAFHQIARWEGLLFLLYYIAYNANIALTAMNSPKVEALHFAVMWIAAPITVIAFILNYGFHRATNRPPDAPQE